MAKPKRIKIEPAAAPMPYSLDDEDAGRTPLEDMKVSAMTAELLEAMGAQIEADPATLKAEKKLLKDAVVDGKVQPLRSSLPASLAAARFLKSYGTNLALDAVQVRTALTHKLLEIADCGDTKYELRAIELLGKHSDIGLFTERSEININYNSPEALEKAIKDRVKRLLNADVIDEKPFGMDLAEELGIVDGEFSDVDGEAEEPLDPSEEVLPPVDDEDTGDDWPDEEDGQGGWFDND